MTPENLKEFLEYIILKIINKEDLEKLDLIKLENKLIFDVKINKENLGRVIGRNGATATAIRNVLQAAAIKLDIKTQINFLS